ncbi:MAG: ABC transporter ATP-binding protein [Saccharospirillaceae bacterium]|nr:ABC transporter ATP-binding protein [Saccharospirillaceae bacterium]
MLRLSHLNCGYDNQTVVRNVSFELKEGEILCLLGSSGCGKTTLLRAIAGFTQVQQGEIHLNDQPIFTKKTNIAPQNREIGMVFQDYALFPHLSVFDNIAFGLHKQDKQNRFERVMELLELIELSEFSQHFPHELSGGQQQRVALARALAPKPKVILLDEPFSNLDLDRRRLLAAQVKYILKQENTSAILVTHDQEEAFIMADQVALLTPLTHSEDSILQMGDAQQLYSTPNSLEVAEFFGDGDFLDIKINKQQFKLFNQYFEFSESEYSGDAKIMLRAENIDFSLDGNIEFIVINKQFHGWYDDVRLSIGQTEVCLQLTRSISNKLNVGQKIKANVIPNNNWIYPE